MFGSGVIAETGKFEFATTLIMKSIHFLWCSINMWKYVQKGNLKGLKKKMLCNV